MSAQKQRRAPLASVKHYLPLGHRLKFLRLANKLTQKQLADIANVQVVTILQLEKGMRKNPTFNTLNKITKALGCDLKIEINQKGIPKRLDHRYLNRNGRVSPKPRHRTLEEAQDLVESLERSARIANYQRKRPQRRKATFAEPEMNLPPDDLSIEKPSE